MSGILRSPHLGVGAVNLWKCGDRVLNNRLSKNLEINVQLESISRLPRSRFPKALFSLSLTTLTIHAPAFEFQTPRDMSALLQLLPSCLEKLTMDIPHKNDCFVDYSPFPASVTRAPPSLADDPSQANIWNIAKVFPHLKTLILPFDDETPQYLWHNADFALLPDGLTELTVQFHSKLDMKTELLPKSLRSFDFTGGGFQSLEQVKNLPPMLERLTFTDDLWFSSQQSYLDILKALPDTITDLDGGVTTEPLALAGMTNLTTVYTHDIPADIFFRGLTILPNLTSLNWFNISDVSTESFFDCKTTLLLPQSLTMLKIPAMRSFGSIRWPSGLTKLKIMNAGQLDKETCLALPPVVTLVLAGSESARFQMVNLKYLPKSIIDLRIRIATDLCEDGLIPYDNYTTAKLNPNAQIPKKGDFPPNLTSLDARVYIMQLECLADLPESITRLEATFEDVLTADIAKRLPRGLRSFEFGPSSRMDAAALAELPSTLTNLLVKHLICPDSDWDDEPTEFCYPLPPSLRSLAINRITYAKLIPPGVSFSLPNTLETLLVEVPTSDHLNLFKDLPRSLRNLSLGVDFRYAAKAPKLEALLREWCPRLPPSLSSFVLISPDPSATLDKSFLDLLPNSITSLQLVSGTTVRGDLLDTFSRQRLVLHTPDRRLLNELNGTNLELEYYYEAPLDEDQDD